MLNIIKRDKYIILFSIMVGLLICFMNIGYTANKYTKEQEDLASRLIRFHCIANSDSKEDQDLKLKVRDAVLKSMSGKLENLQNINDTRRVIQENTDYITTIAESVIKEEGKDYSIEVKLEKNVQFPVKEYGNVVLPAGNYEAVRIIIGNGEGKNWWCVMFPPLCFVDESTCVVDEKTNEKIKNAVTEEQYNSIVKEKKVSVKFKMFS